MNEQSKKNFYSDQTKIVISAGDEGGIGSEIILKALASKKLPKNINILVVGSKRNLLNTYKLLKKVGIKDVANPNSLNIEDVKVSTMNTAEVAARNGNASYKYLKRAIDIVKSSSNTALVTAPICKKSWALAGHYYAGQTELLAESFNSSNVGMLFTAQSPITGWRLNTLLTTTHLPLNEISKNLTGSLISSKLDLLYDFCRRFNNRPRLKVAGLNPHAGEEGILGKEENDFIKSTLRNWNKRNPNVTLEGPLSPDSCWITSLQAWGENKEYGHDGILAMYHDQGLIPMKLIALNYSVNTTLGLPIIRTSPDHGTGFDIFGKGIAQSKSMLEAIKTAHDLCSRSRLLDPHQNLTKFNRSTIIN